MKSNFLIKYLIFNTIIITLNFLFLIFLNLYDFSRTFTIYASLILGVFLFILFLMLLFIFIKFAIEKNGDIDADFRGKSFSKADFIANISHEIRTPLNAIYGFSEMLLGENLNQENQHAVKMIMESTSSLLLLVNQILDLSKIESGKLSLDKNLFNLNAVIYEACEMLRPKLYRKDVEMLCDLQGLPEMVIGDRLKLQEVFLNLLSNAVKYTFKGEIFVRARVEQETETKVSINFEIIDTGVGILEEKLAKIFEPFNQATSEDSEFYGGTGLGLTISKKIVKLMDGQISASSTKDQGTKITFNVSLSKQVNDPLNHKKLIVNEELKDLKVLVLDDNPHSLDIFKNLALEAGINIVTTVSTTEALDRVAKVNYDVMIIDYHMPGFDGNQVASVIQKMGLSKLPGLVLLSSDYPENFKTISNNGFITSLLKPVRKSLFISAILKAAKKKDQRISFQKPKFFSSTFANEDLNVLLAEDNEINQEMMIRMFKKIGINVDIAEDGQKALEKASGKKYHIIFMDVQMPHLDGFEATKALRNAGVEAPIIAMTAHALSDDRQKCINSGMDDYIAKPVKREPLIDMIKKYYSCNTPLSIKKIKVLIIDDDKMLCIVCENELKNSIYLDKLITCQDGLKGCTLLGSMLPDLLVLDIMLPGIEGTGILKMLKEDKRFIKTKVIVITGLKENDKRIKEMTDLGADFILLKPFKPDVLVTNILKLFPDAAKKTDENLNTNVFYKEMADELGFECDEYKIMLEKFLNKTAERITSLKNSVDENDFISIERIAHSIKGSSSNLFIKEITDVVTSLEIDARNKNREKIISLHNALKDEFQKLKNQFELSK